MPSVTPVTAVFNLAGFMLSFFRALSFGWYPEIKMLTTYPDFPAAPNPAAFPVAQAQ